MVSRSRAFCLIAFGLFLILTYSLFAPTSVDAGLIDKAMGAYASGNPSEARRLAQVVLARESADPRALLLIARTEPGGRTAQSWAEQAIATAEGKPPGDEATLFLIEAYAATRSYGAVAERAERFFRTFGRENEFADAVRWWAAIADLKLNRRAAADADLQWAGSNPESSTWSRRLRLLYADSRVEVEPAIRAYRELLNVKDRYLESQALLGVVWAYQKLGEADREILYRGILTEKYPRVVEHFLGVSTATGSEEPPPDDTAEILAEIEYAVQLGAFSDRKNAERLRDKYRRRGYTVHFFSRKVAGKRYWVVQVGSFTAVEKAKKLMRKLQQEDQAAYRVIVR